MPKKKQSGGSNQDPFHLVLGRPEQSEIKWRWGAIIMTAFSVLIIAFLLNTISQKDALIQELSEKRMMIGFPNEDGVIVSTDSRPRSLVKRFARDYVFNLYNYDWKTVNENLQQAARMMDAKAAAQREKTFRDLVQDVRDNRLSQSIRIRQERLKHTGESYVYEARIQLEQYVSQSPSDTLQRTVRVRLGQVPPTASRKEGLKVLSSKDFPANGNQ